MIGLLKRAIWGRKTGPTPTDILVGLVCIQIEKEPRTTDAMLARECYHSHHWKWAEKSIVLRFHTKSYASNASVVGITSLTHAGTSIALTSLQKTRLRVSLNTANQFALALAETEKIAQQELAACDAIEAILK